MKKAPGKPPTCPECPPPRPRPKVACDGINCPMADAFFKIFGHTRVEPKTPKTKNK